MSTRLKQVLKISVSLIIVVVSIYYATKGVDLKLLGKALMTADYKWALLPIPIILLSHWIRAMRWRTMLKPILHANSTWNLFSAVMIGYAFNAVTPRGGEFVRPYVYARREKVSFSSVFATIIVERFIDIIVLMMLLAFAFFVHREKIVSVLPSDINPNKIIYLSALIVAVLIVSFYPPFVEFFLRIIIKPISEKFYNKILELFNKFKVGFGIIKKPSQYFRVTIESLGIWLCYALPLYFTFFAFDFQSVLHLGLWDALFLLIVSGVAVTIAPAAGGVGVYHGMMVAAMTQLYSISHVEALAYATIAHAVNFFVSIIVGGLFFMKENISKIPTAENMPDDFAEPAIHKNKQPK